ncbi:MAG: molecular chaperone DnaJ [Mesorhizobium amorphae]|nr:MAG: molecular chaperone DnaJ [Mesorhizobium amorphae]
MSDPYQTLGIAPTASADELRSAYRKLAKTLHPDLNPGDKGAEDRFKEVTAAYDLLRDPEKRKRFDAGEIDGQGNERPRQPFYRDFAEGEGARRYSSDAGYADYAEDDDFLAELLRRNARARANRPGRDHHYSLVIDLADAIRGGEKHVTLPGGDNLAVKIPAGVTDGQTLRLKGKGEPGQGTGAAGSALIEISVAEDPRFTREGDDLTIEIPVSLSEAVLGGRISVPTPTGSVAMTLPKGADGTTKLRLKGQGMPKGGGLRGDEYVRLRIVLAKPLDPALEAFVSGWEAGRGFDPREEGGR